MLREVALGCPGAWEDHPWGEDVVKVGKRIFVFFGTPGDAGRHRFFVVKLPESSPMALTFHYVTPTGYGLGKGGWVTVEEPPEDRPWDLFADWLDESYRAVAPKRLIRELESR